MTKARAEQFSLDEALADPGFTPRQRDVPALFARLESGDAASRSAAEKALLRVQAPLDLALAERLRATTAEARTRLLRVASQLVARSDDPLVLRTAIGEALTSDEPRVRRAAATALGKMKHKGSETLLLAALAREGTRTSTVASRDPRVAEAIIEALGKVGSKGAAEAIARASKAGLGESAIDKATLMLERTELREAPSQLMLERSLDHPTVVTLRCREGLEEILAAELDARLAPKIPKTDRGRVDVTLRGSPDVLFQARTFLCFGFSLEARSESEDLASAVTETLSSDLARRIFRTFTEGPIRFRVSWAGGGKRRKTTWDLARAMHARAPELVNDPTDSLWDAVVHERASMPIRIELVPRVADPRFAYREADVPAASHPTLAAALVRCAGIEENDVVWDPFVGSATELCERVLAGPSAMIVGSDLDERALAAARENLDRVGATGALLRRADARSFDPRAIGGRARAGVTLIVTNPPMGRRVARGEDLEALLRLVVTRASELLTPTGRLVWLSPLPRATRSFAAKSGLLVRSATTVDMGGFPAELQVLARQRAQK